MQITFRTYIYPQDKMYNMSDILPLNTLHTIWGIFVSVYFLISKHITNIQLGNLFFITCYKQPLLECIWQLFSNKKISVLLV